ncbi:hypothetical protein RvY_00309 [Ramazzottius varieornatus]|uniref:Uncharacterized protein n=1 Tax=Ramazzottius varieornatus TaxID=947166 RepID=A0A1D1UCC6_RAMVA|nr:hypothetical protein RvY_00309 [Ramazzottius varieornatus]
MVLHVRLRYGAQLNSDRCGCRFDPGNQAALQHFLKGKLMEFAATSHPLATTLVLLIIKFKARPIHRE